MRNRSILWALLLIGIGVLLLLRNSGTIPKDVRIWPLIVLVIGVWLLLDRLAFEGRRDGGFVWPLLLIAVGGVFLLQDLHAIDADVTLWPVILIAIGLGIVLAAVPSRGQSAQTVTESVPLEGASFGRVVLRHGAGRLSVRSMLDPSLMLQGTFAGGVDVERRREGETAVVTVRQRSGAWTEWAFPWHWGGGQALDWNVALTRTIPLALQVDGGANQATLDLSELSVSELRLKTGASDTTITMPAKGTTRAFVSCGAARVVVRIADRASARIVARTGLASVRVDEVRFPRTTHGWASPDFDQAVDRVDLEIEGGAASFEVR